MSTLGTFGISLSAPLQAKGLKSTSILLDNIIDEDCLELIMLD